MSEVVFRAVKGNAVPCQPWPQSFYVTRNLLNKDAVEVRPLTATGLVKGVGRNFVTMNYWRFMRLLRILGFLSTPEACVLSWRDLTWRCWEHQMWRRLWIVKLYRRLSA